MSRGIGPHRQSEVEVRELSSRAFLRISRLFGVFGRSPREAALFILSLRRPYVLRATRAPRNKRGGAKVDVSAELVRGGGDLDASTAGGVTRRVFAFCRRSTASLKGLWTEHSKNGSRADPSTLKSVGLGRTVVRCYQFFGGGVLPVSGQQNHPPAGTM